MRLDRTSAKRLLLGSVAAVAIAAYAVAATAADVPKYVFMFIGDGMGIAQRQVAELQLNTAVGKRAANQKNRLFMNTLKVTGVNTTWDSTSMVPDSASTATSLSSGYKTWSGVLGMMEDKTTPTPSITEALKKKGYEIGIISDVKIVHATPAAYYAHIDARGKYDEIAMQLINSGFDLFVGGGGDKHFSASKRSDGKDVYKLAESKGFQTTTSSKGFLAMKPGKPVLANLPGDVYDEALPYVLDRGADDLNLDQVLDKSIELLGNGSKPFFMLFEGGKVDWACHANDTGSAIANMIDFDKAIGAAIAFKKTHPDTLIVVTGDHECGGLGLSMGNEYRVSPELFRAQTLSYEMVDVKVQQLLKAGAPMAKIYALAADYGLANLTDDEKAQIDKAVKDQTDPDVKTKSAKLYGGYQPVSMTFNRLMNVRANLYWTSYAHTGIPVMLTADGVGAEEFAGYLDNTEVCFAMNKVLKAGMKW